MVPEYKSLGEMVQADPVLKNRVVVAKVGVKSCALRSSRAQLRASVAAAAAAAARLHGARPHAPAAPRRTTRCARR